MNEKQNKDSDSSRERILTRKEFEACDGMISGGEAVITKAEFPELFEALEKQATNENPR